MRGIPAALFPQDRQQLILELLETQGSLASSDLADSLGVNPATIRRDLRSLAEQGLIDLVHGGARRGGGARPLVREVDLLTKQVTNLAAKRTIAEKAAGLITSGSTVALNAGSTVEMIAGSISPGITGCTFITLSLNVASTLALRPDTRLLLAGGLYRAPSQSFVGDHAVAMIEGLHADIALLGASAVDIHTGWTHPALEEVRPNQVMMRMAEKRYLVCDSSKFGVTGLARISGLADFTGIVSDGNLPTEVIEWAREHSIDVI